MTLLIIVDDQVMSRCTVTIPFDAFQTRRAM